MDDNSERLRAKAKEELRQGKRIDASLYETDLKILVEELSVYQIELEHQNQELMESQDHLQQSNDRYLDLFDNAPIGYMVVDRSGVIKDINQTAALLLERSKNEFVDFKITKFIHPDYQDIYYLYFQALINQKHNQTCDIKIKRPNNTYFFARIQGIRQSQYMGADPEFRLAIIDVSVQKEIEQKLLIAKQHALDSEERFKALHDASFGGIVIHDKGKIIECNQGLSEITGYTYAELIGMDGLLLISEKTRNNVLNNILAGYEKPYEAIGVRKNGEEFPLRLEGRNIHFKGKMVRTVEFRDITDLKQAEELVREKEVQYRNLANFGIALIWTSGTDKLCNYFNEPWLKFTGRKLEQELGNGWAEGVHPEDFDRCLKTYVDAFDKQEAFEMEYRLKHSSGEYRWILDLGNPNFNSSKEFVGYIGYCFDITERKQIERELIKSKNHAEESDRLKSAFLANMSHEIRTPMNGILGFADLLKNPDLTGEQQKNFIDIIEKSGLRMLNIINNIVDFSKIEAGLMKLDNKETNINEQIDFVYTFFKPEVEAKGMKLSFKTTLTAKEATISTDSEKVYAILTNLVKNAIKYSRHGTIEFGYNLVAESGLVITGDVDTHVETGHALSLLQFYVKDTGIGIPKDRQEAIFERFIQADISDKLAQQGAGLGLAISKAYVEMMGGKIWVESEEGIGSTFFFTLPYYTHPINESIIHLSPSDESDLVKNIKILIAEDDEISELLLDETVKAYSKEIIKARNGHEAIQECRKNPDIDLILMDIRMPEMGGYEATRQIREFNKNVVIIAQTAYGYTGDKEKAFEAGCNDYVSKPIRKKELFGLIQKYFGN